MSDAPPGSPGLYLHIPYCRSICPYCDFNVYRAPKSPPFAALADAMMHELGQRGPSTAGPLASIYFGGGTPSLAPVDVLCSLIERVQSLMGLRPGAEITLEADPGTLTPEALVALRQGGVNRLSIGWQSSHNSLLRTLGRPHSAQAGVEAVAMARDAGFTNISLDLIFAVPKQTLTQLHQDLERLVALRPEHVSLYALTYHAGTPFARRLGQGTLQAAPEELELSMMEAIGETLTAHDFEHYEVSNFAKAGRRAVHNSLYWQYGDVLGLGPGAHSFVRTGPTSARRWSNVRGPASYLKIFAPGTKLDAAPLPGVNDPQVMEAERLRGPDMVLEQMMVGLRLIEGVALGPVRRCLEDGAAVQHFEEAVAKLQQQGLATLMGDRLVLSGRGRALCDSAAALFVRP